MTEFDIFQNLKAANTYELVFLIDCYTCDSAAYSYFPIQALLEEVTERYINGEFFEIFEYLLLAEENDAIYECCKKAIDAVLTRAEPEIPSFHLCTMFKLLHKTLVYDKKKNQKWVPANMDLFWKWNDDYIASVDNQLTEKTRKTQKKKEDCIKKMLLDIEND